MPRTRSAASRPGILPVGAAALVTLLAACSGTSEPDEPEPTEDYVLGCGIVDEDLVVEVMGPDVTSQGFGAEPRDQVSECDITKVGQSGHFMLIRARYPSAQELAERRSTWPQRPADVRGCRGTWVAPGRDAYGAACVEDDDDFESTLLSALWGDLAVNVTISRPDGADPGDARAAYEISRSVAEHLQD